ncbi:MAG: IPT/TIG domain-containing protein [Acidobacteriaceae bacterium]|nr:IPT/TIG domain-containing protein [Acidobacteriaceae bacterium]
MSRFLRLLAAILLVMVVVPALAGGPRFVTGAQYANPGQPMAFRTNNVLYFTDPAVLNSSVTHAQADAVVAAAAAVWTVPVASLTLSQGGTLSEHVSSGNTYFDGTAVVFPADVQASNYLGKPIAIVYDSDGSVTDLLLGSGASSLSSCRQNEVLESVDGFGAAGTIDHALIVVNGKCVTSSTDSLKQLQYLVMRAFGRVLGLGWSQTNDNVFTAASTPNARQVVYWPVMHPIDVLCGSYTYLCMTNPFTLRADDLSALTMLYPVTTEANGKIPSLSQAVRFNGVIQNEDGYVTGSGSVNVNVRLMVGFVPSDWQYASSVSGYLFRQNAGNPVSGAPPEQLDTGVSNVDLQGYYNVARVPMTEGAVRYVIETEAVNPLYTGQYALGNWQRPPVTPTSTGNITWGDYGGTDTVTSRTVLNDGPERCYTSTNGTEGNPVATAAGGWWSDVLCGSQFPAWSVTPTLRGGRSWTLETLAQDEQGNTSTNKAQPVIGVWRARDDGGLLPTVASATVPMNGSVAGLTQLKVSASAADASYRVAIADYYGDGRPDYLYKARLMYADAVSPSSVSSSGGQISITGMGFASGNRVTVNGVVASVVSWSANTIVAVAPTSVLAKATSGVPVSVAVTDMTTGAATSITGALVYAGAGAYTVAKVSAPASLATGMTAATSFAVRVLASDGVTPIAGASVSLAVSGGASLVACGVASSCVLTADANGLVQSKVAGVAAGLVTLSATELSGGASVQVAVTDADPVRSVQMLATAAWVAAGGSVSLPVVLNAVQDGSPASGVPVAWSASSGLTLSATSSLTAANGVASVSVGMNGLASGTAQVQGCAWSTVCAMWMVIAVDASQWVPSLASGAGQSVASSATFQPVVVVVSDAAGHVLPGAAVTIAQTVTAWEGACPTQGRCPAAPVLTKSQTAAVTGADGSVSFAPLEVANTAAVTNVAVSAGTNGFVAMSLVKVP